MTLATILSEVWVQKLGWTLVHFIWQGCFAAVLAALLLSLLRNRSANSRYWTVCALFLATALLPILTYRWIEIEPPFVMAQPVDPTFSPTLGRIESEVHSESPAAPLSLTEVSAPTDLPTPPTATKSWHEQLTVWLQPALPWMVGFWFLGVALLSVRQFFGWVLVQRLRRRYVEPVGEAIARRAQDLAQRIRISRTVRILESTLAEAPLTLGWLKPVILLPASALAGLSPAQLEAILAHELAHIRRYDYLVNLFQIAAETLLFYHPAVWWISKCIRVERENCCDDIAVAVCGDAAAYARALAEVANLGIKPAAALGMGDGSLLGRVRRLMSQAEQPKSRFAEGWIWSFLIVLVLIVTTALNNSQSGSPANTRTVLTAGAAASVYEGDIQRDATLPLEASVGFENYEEVLRFDTISFRREWGQLVALLHASYQTTPNSGWEVTCQLLSKEGKVLKSSQYGSPIILGLGSPVDDGDGAWGETLRFDFDMTSEINQADRFRIFLRNDWYLDQTVPERNKQPLTSSALSEVLKNRFATVLGATETEESARQVTELIRDTCGDGPYWPSSFFLDQSLGRLLSDYPLWQDSEKKHLAGLVGSFLAVSFKHPPSEPLAAELTTQLSHLRYRIQNGLFETLESSKEPQKSVLKQRVSHYLNLAMSEIQVLYIQDPLWPMFKTPLDNQTLSDIKKVIDRDLQRISQTFQSRPTEPVGELFTMVSNQFMIGAFHSTLKMIGRIATKRFAHRAGYHSQSGRLIWEFDIPETKYQLKEFIQELSIKCGFEESVAGKSDAGPQKERTLALNQNGASEATSAVSTTGAVQGQVFIGDKPAANADITYDRYSPEHGPTSNKPIPTDSDGRFIVKDLPPGKYRFGRLKMWDQRLDGRSSPMGTGTHGIRVEVIPGATTEVKIGGEGRKVVGRFVTEDSDLDVKTLFQATEKRYFNLQEDRSDGFPSTLLVLEIDDDGTFSIPDVRPGTYKLDLSVRESWENPMDLWLTATPADFDIPAATPGSIDPYDVGRVRLRLPPEEETGLYPTIEQGKIDWFKQALETNPSLLSAPNSKGETPLHLAARLGQLEIVQFLVEHGVDINAKSLSGATPWKEAAHNGHMHVANWLKANGATWEDISLFGIEQPEIKK